MTDSAKRSESGHKRWWLWLPLLGLGGWLTVFGDKTPASSSHDLSLPTRASPQSLSNPNVDTTGRDKGGQAADQASGEFMLAPIARHELIAKAQDASGDKQQVRDLFTARNWNPPPPPPVPAPAPVAPALPFQYLGKKLEAEAWEVYLGQGEQTYIVREGQVLNGMYRVDKIAPPTLALTYIPLGEVQTLSIGENR